jgi:hypothetical protein
MWGSGNIVLRNFDLGYGKRLCSQGNSPLYTLNRRLSGFRVLSGRPGEARNFLTLPVIEKRFLDILSTRCIDCQNMNETIRTILNLDKIFALLGCVRSADWYLFADLSAKQSVPSSRVRQFKKNFGDQPTDRPTNQLTDQPTDRPTN